MFSNLPPLSVVALALAFALLPGSFIFVGSVSGVEAKAGPVVATFVSNEVCFLLFKSPKRRGLGDIDRLCKLGKASKVLSDCKTKAIS